MRSALLVFGITLAAVPVRGEIIHKIQSSVSLSVDGAGSVAIRQPSSMAVSGSNVTLDTAPTLGTLTPGTALGYTPGAYSITTAGDAFTYAESFNGGDNTPSLLSTTVTTGVVPALPVFGNVTTTSGGVASGLSGSIATDGAISITAGGAGTQAVGQVILELSIR